MNLSRTFRVCVIKWLAPALMLAGVSTATAGVVESTGINFTRPEGIGEHAIVLPVGDTIIAGRFDVVQGKLRNGIARLRADGSVDANWDAACVGLTGTRGCWFRQIKLGPDGWIYVLGDFSSLGGQARKGLARIALANGRVDENWNPVPAETNAPDAFVLLPDGVVASSQVVHTKYALTGAGAAIPSFETSAAYLVGYAGGALFGTAQFSPPTLIRIDAQTGQTDPTWTAGVDVVSWVLADPTSASIIGRTAATAEEPAGRLVKVNAQTSPGWMPGWQPPSIGFVQAALGSDGRLHLLDPAINGFGQGRLTTLNLAGTGAVLREVDLPLITSNQVRLLAVDGAGRPILSALAADDIQPDGWTADGSAIGRITTSGVVDPQWRPGIYSYGLIYAAEKTPDGGVLVAGSFDRVSGVKRRGIAKFDAALRLDPWQAQVPQRSFTAASVDADGNVYVSSRDGFATLLRLSRASGAIDPSWNPSGVAGPPMGEIEELLVDRANNVLYARFPYFSFNICGANRTALAKLSLSPGCAADPVLQIAPPAPLNDMLVHDGALYIAGNFDSIAGQPIASLARFSANGAIDAAWRPFQASSFPGPLVLSATATPRGLVASGAFGEVQGTPRPAIAMFDYLTGSLDSVWSQLGAAPIINSTGTLGDDVLLHRLDESVPGSIGQLALVPIAGNGGVDPTWPALNVRANRDSRRPIFLLPLDSNRTLAIGPFTGFGDTATGNTALLYRRGIGVFADGFETID